MRRHWLHSRWRIFFDRMRPEPLPNYIDLCNAWRCQTCDAVGTSSRTCPKCTGEQLEEMWGIVYRRRK